MYRSKKVGSLVKEYLVDNCSLCNSAMVEVKLNSGYAYGKKIRATDYSNELVCEVSTSGLVYIKTYEFNRTYSYEHYYILNAADFSFEVLLSKHVCHYE